MVRYNESEYKNKRADFEREFKRIEPYKSRRPLTKDLNKRKEYKQCLIEAYNNIILFFQPFLKTAVLEEKLDIQTQIVEHRRKLTDAFAILRLECTFGKCISDTIDLDQVEEGWTDLDN